MKERKKGKLNSFPSKKSVQSIELTHIQLSRRALFENKLYAVTDIWSLSNIADNFN